MNARLSRFIISSIIPVLLLGLSLPAKAETAQPPGPAVTGPPNGPLTQAYVILSMSNRDYQGHRVKAMKHLEAAAKELGFSLQGEGKGQGRKQQIISDQQLQVAQRDLQQALPGLPPKAQAQVQKAVDEISAALKVK
jgi:hypothetical protein